MSEPLTARRARLMGPGVPTFHDEPLHLVRGQGVWLWDAGGRRYLDAYNNVPHVGHAHPAVVEAVARQAGTLNVHSRYLHTLVLDYIDRLTGTLGHDLSQMILTCTGSEANDVALRMAQAATGRRGLIATDTTYHGNTAATSALSARRPPVGGRPPHVRLVPAPEGQDAAAFAAGVAQAVRELETTGFGVAAMMLCPVFANEGLPDVGPGFFDPAAAVVRQAGGLIIADEVQPGFGRLGSHFWGHGWLRLAPDVVTMGKPMGNGYPLAGLAARPDLMAAFRRAFGYFNTFAATPVAAAAGMAVLDVMEAEGLPSSAAATGAHLLARLQALWHPAVARVTGRGLFFAVELRGPDGAPAPGRAHRTVEAMRRRGVLIGRIGRHDHILKLRPPLPFGRAHADQAADALADALADTDVGADG